MLLAGLGLASCDLSIHRTPFLVRGRTGAIPVEPGPGFTLVSWNVHKGTDSVFLADVANLLDSTRADIVLFQEASVDVDSTSFADALGGREWALSSNLYRSSPHREFGVATASSTPMEDATALLSVDGEPFAGTRKAALATRHRFATGTVHVVNLHALNFSPSPGGFRRQLAEIAEQLRGEAAPAVVAGDFNTWNRWKHRIADSILSAKGLVRLDFGGQEARKTAVFGHPLDHVYYTAGFLEVDSSTAIVHTWIRSSDHFPLSVHFRMKSPVVAGTF